MVVDCHEEVVSLIRRSTKYFYSVGKACAIPADEVSKKYPSAADVIAACRTVPLKIGERLLQIVAVDDDGLVDEDDQMPVCIQISPFTNIIPRGTVLPPFKTGWLSKLKEITQS